jgi:uncharacterized protein
VASWSERSRALLTLWAFFVRVISPQHAMIIGVISDTHGLLRPQALQALAGSDIILHAGDIGSPEIVLRLEEIAPVYAIRGNVDVEPWAKTFPDTRIVKALEHEFFLIHNRADLGKKLPKVSAIIFGHSHQPLAENKQGLLFFNPGSAGPRRFKLPISVGRISVLGKELKPELITLSA